MSAEQLVSTLEKLHKLHISLFDLSVKKTDIIKSGDMDKLDQSLKDEQKHIAAINTIEAERQKQAQKFLQIRQGSMQKSPTISECLQFATMEEKELLYNAQEKLIDIIQQLKERNDLNQKLTYQSLQFVNMNLSLMQPQRDQATYSRPTNNTKQHSGQRSMFDSKA